MSAVKALGGLVVLAVVLGGGLVAGDRYAEARAEEYTTALVSDSISATGTPQVDILGFPFLTQLVGGTLDEVTATVGAATLQGVPVTDVTIDARRVLVRPPAGQQPTAGEATVSATIPTASLEQVVRDRTRLTLGLAVEGTTLVGTGTVLGLPVRIGFGPRASQGKLLAEVQTFTLGGRDVALDSLPAAIRDRLKVVEVPLEGLPPGLGLTDATVVPSGVRITAAGTDVAVPEPTTSGTSTR